LVAVKTVRKHKVDINRALLQDMQMVMEDLLR
jgi:hypothetical protein